ncbi:MAG TPA: hypothetical protein PLZ43_13935 [bacterium]|nr:hypothetical protein [bacterium]
MKETTIENNDSILTSGIEIIGDEIKLHPVISGIAAFSVGFIVAALIFRSSK